MAVSAHELVDDPALVRAVQAGDTEAFGELFRRHYPTVRRACARRLRNMAEADEIAQAAFVRAFERIGLCGGDRRFRPWVLVIAQRLCVDHARARARTTPQEQPIRSDQAIGPNVPEEELLSGQTRSDVHVALAALPPRQRQVVIARDLQERRPTEIAAALGVSVGAVDSLLLRARRHLALLYRSVTGEGGTATVSSSATSAALAGGGVVASTGSVAAGIAVVADVVGGMVHHATTATAILVPSPTASSGRRLLASMATAVLSALSSPVVAASPPPPPPVVRISLPAAAPVINLPPTLVPAMADPAALPAAVRHTGQQAPPAPVPSVTRVVPAEAIPADPAQVPASVVQDTKVEGAPSKVVRSLSPFLSTL